MSKISYNLDNKVVLITGGSSGIGLSLALEFLNQKAKVIICGRKEEHLKKAAQILWDHSGLTAIQAHIAREEDVVSMFDRVEKEFGRLDILVNNVGMNLVTPSIVDAKYEQWNKIIDTNLNGTFLCSRSAAGIMKKQRSGKIVSISSIAGRKATPAMGIYGIAKAGMEMMTKVLAAELASYNIQVNAVAPGMVRTEFSEPFWNNEELYKTIIKAIPMGRIAEIKDILDPLLFLCSEGSSFITGETLVVDGGATVI